MSIISTPRSRAQDDLIRELQAMIAAGHRAVDAWREIEKEGPAVPTDLFPFTDLINSPTQAFEEELSEWYQWAEDLEQCFLEEQVEELK